jgi:hypothetical protein
MTPPADGEPMTRTFTLSDEDYNLMIIVLAQAAGRASVNNPPLFRQIQRLRNNIKDANPRQIEEIKP